MPTREQNCKLWTRYDWGGGGEEWSARWGNTANLWHGTLLPRIGAFVGDVDALEIAPGYGRLSAHLRHHCSSLLLVDMAPNCVDACLQRFHDDPRIRCHLNDGRSLSCAADASLDFVFSFDSLVHADLETLGEYLGEIRRVLRPDGHAFLHHSNLHAVLAAESGRGAIANNHLRSPDVSASLVLEACDAVAGLSCISQEIIPWDGSGRLIDCFSVFATTSARRTDEPDVFVNPHFHEQALQFGEIARHYSGTSRL
ncbi:MAG: class I SAM-dependent methyltransferase [Pseudomonadota bacterium]